MQLIEREIDIWRQIDNKDSMQVSREENLFFLETGS